MGTTWSAKFLQPSTPLDPAAVTQKISARLETLEQQFSTYRPTSELSRFNASRGVVWFPVSPELARVVFDSTHLSQRTSGAYDPTVAPLLRLWGFGPHARTGTAPTDGEIQDACRHVDWGLLDAQLSPPALRKAAPELEADLSSMAKGFSSDALSELLTSLGAPDHFVQIGGDINTRGHAADGGLWRTGIEEPVVAGLVEPGPGSTTPATSTTHIACIVSLDGQALSTSGNYRNFVTLAGRRYGHILDPRTGRPVENTLAAVSVIAPTCAESSALATALFVLGEDVGLALAVREKIAAVFFVRSGDAITQRRTQEFEKFSR